MNILVTGGLGEVGRPTIKWLLAHGHTVRVLDLHISAPLPGAECHAGDVTDFATLPPLLADIEGIIHLAAYRHPSLAPNPEMFRVNCLGTMNIFKAAVDAGIRRIVCASSINALGYNFGRTFPDDQLQYFPVDEDHPPFTTDPYSFSKHVIEDIGAYFWRRAGVTSIFLRLPAVYDLSTPGPSILKDFVTACYLQTASLLATTEPARTKRAHAIIADFEQRAASGQWETEFDLTFPDAALMFGRSNFWTSLDARDAAQAIEKSLLADIQGSHILYVTDPHNFVGLPTHELAALFFPQVTAWKHTVQGTEALISIARAQALIGFAPQYPFKMT